MKRPLAPLCVLFLTAFASRSHAGVLVVDAGGAGSHEDIQAAVDAALDGDTILVRRPPIVTRRFRGFVVDGKSLVIQGDTIEPARVGPVFVRNLGPGQQVELSHLHVNPEGYPPPPAPNAVGLELDDNRGVVWVHACDIRGASPLDGEGVLAMRVRACERTIVTDSHIEGGEGDEQLDSGGGIVARGSALWLYGSEVAGAKGGFGSFGYDPAGRGGDGVRLRASSLYASGSLIRGGNGGDTLNDISEGGDGLVVPDDSTAVAFDTEILGGQPGIFSYGTPGEAVIGIVNQIPGSAPTFESPQTAEQGTTVTLNFVGAAGDSVVLLVSGRVVTNPLGGTAGYLHVGRPFRRILIGTLPASGEASFPFVVPDAPPGGARNLVMQAVFVRPGSGSLATGPELLSSLDPRFVPRCGGRIHVDANAPPGGDGSSWASAYRNLRVALGAVPECPDDATEVWVAEGTYRPAGPGGDRDRNFYIYPDTHLYGGFEGIEAQLDERDPAAHPVILSGDLNGDDTPGFGNRADNSAHVLQAGVHLIQTRDVRIDGFIVRGGNAVDQVDQLVQSEGGGLVAHGRIEIARCAFIDNYADRYGGGVHWSGASLSVSHCRFTGNSTGGRGAGMRIDTGGPVRVSNSLFAWNVSTGSGAGGLSIRACCPDTTREIRNCVVYANEGGFTSGGIADGVVQDDPLIVTNTVIWGNVSNSGSGQDAQLWYHTDDALVAFNCVQGLSGLPGAGNIGDDPLFVDPVGPDGIPGTDDDDFRLDAASPCIDAGTNLEAATDFADLDHDGDTNEPAPFDLAGALRFEDDPNTPDTGEGSPPLVDMGVFERSP